MVLLYTPKNALGTTVKVSQVSGVIHFAASKSVPENIDLPLRYYGNNVSGLMYFFGKILIPVVTGVMTVESTMLSVFGSDYDTRDDMAVRDFYHVTDLTLGHLAALDAMADGRIRGKFRTFNLGSSTSHSVLEVVAAMEKVSQKPIRY
jgi:UDP-glucose 4-epimerase